jgi:fructose-1,6-bisphosphatase/inositol monophosphatase family enzyme
MKTWVGLGVRCLGVVLSLSYLCTQCLFAYQPEKGFWTERRQASRRQTAPLLASLPGVSSPFSAKSLAAQFPAVKSVGSSLSHSVAKTIPKSFLKTHSALLAALSPAHGSVRKVSLPKGGAIEGPVVIHIQDVHMNQEAQWNIRESVRLLMESGQVGLVALEGATEAIALQRFVEFPDRRAMESTANYLLKQNKITGPIHAAFTATGTLPKIRGIDDPTHYQANVQAYKDSAPRLDKMRAKVKALAAQWESEKAGVFSPRLQAFDKKVQAYRAEKISLGDYVRELKEVGGDFPFAISLRQFVEALEMERTLNFSRVELERAEMIEGLTGKLDPQETAALLAQSMAYRSGQLSYAGFYTRLRELCRTKGLSLSNYPALDAYVRYVLLADGIDTEQLLQEISLQEKRVYDRMALTPEEKRLIVRSREAWLTEKLAEFSLTPADWKEYETTVSRGGQEDLASFESFYREAEARDGAMAENLMKAMGQEPDSPSVSILVTGGYHAEGVANKLTENGMTVISYVPKIEKIDTAQGSAYLSVFSQEKTPLEKLFAGQKLFLGFNPVAGVPDAVVVAPALAHLEGTARNRISDADRAKLMGYLNKFYPDLKLTLEDPQPMREGGWRAEVRVQNGEEDNSFSLITNTNFDIQSFGLIEREDRPPFGGLLKLFIPVHVFLQGHAGKVSVWTEALMFATIKSWTPANFLWFAQRHKVENAQELTSLLAWMAIHSIPSKSRVEKRGRLFDFLGELKLRFDQHKFWNALGLIPLAAKKTQGKPKKSRNPPMPRELGFKELKVLDKPEIALNGGREVFVRIMVSRMGRYLLLPKREKNSVKINLDNPGGGATGVKEAGGLSLFTGMVREFWEELKVNFKKYLNSSVNLATPNNNGASDTIYSIPGPNANPDQRRAIVYRSVELNENEKWRMELSDEHVGKPLWMSLPDVLNRFSSLNTGPKMGFYLEFLREAYGIAGVISLSSLSDGFRLKSLTNTVLIETDHGWYLYGVPNDLKAIERLNEIDPLLKVSDRVPRRTDEASRLLGWKNPAPRQGEKGKNDPEPTVMRKLTSSGLVPPPREIWGKDFSNKLAHHEIPEKRRGSLQTCLLPFLPEGAVSETSIRAMLRREGSYGFVEVSDHKNELLGVTGAGPLETLIDPLKEKLNGINIHGPIIVHPTPFLVHSVQKPGDQLSYLSVHMGVVDLEKSDIPNGDSGLIFKSYGETKAEFTEITLAARMIFLRDVFRKEYGLDVLSVKPFGPPVPGAEFPLLVITQGESFVFREANIFYDDKKNTIPVAQKKDGSNGYYVALGGKNYLLVKKSEETLRQNEWAYSHLNLANPTNDVRGLRSIANRIKMAPLWKELLRARTALAREKKENPWRFEKPDTSPVTEWDYRLQLAFLEMVEFLFPDAHVVGEENLLDEKFLKYLSEEQQAKLRHIILKTNENPAKGITIFVDPIDGTNAFVSGESPHFAFTFGVMRNGQPLFAATYSPATGMLVEADAVHGLIFVNGEQVSKPQSPYAQVKVQKGLKGGWDQIDPAPFLHVDSIIPSIAVISAELASRGGAVLVLNEHVRLWDVVPAAIMLGVAGYNVSDYHGENVFNKLRKMMPGVPLHKISTSFMAAPPGAYEHLRTLNDQARAIVQKEKGNQGRATGWMGVGIAWGLGWGVGVFRTWLNKSEKEETPSSYARGFVSFNQGINASRAEDGVNALVSMAAFWMAGQSWMGVVWAPSLVLVGIWFLVFVASHYEKKIGEGSKTPLEKLTGLSPSYRKAVQLFGFYLLPLLTSLFMGAASVPFEFGVLLVFLYFPLMRRAHDQINEEGETDLGGRGTYSNFLFPASAAYWFARGSGKDASEAHGIGWKWILLEWFSLIGLTMLGGLSSGLGTENVLGFSIDPVLFSMALLGHFAIAWGRFELMARVEKMQGETPPAVGSVTRYLILFGLFLVPGGLLIGPLVNFVVALLQWDADARAPSDKLPWSMETTRKGYRIHLIDSEHGEGKIARWLSGNEAIQFQINKNSQGKSGFVHAVMKPKGKTEYRAVHTHAFNPEKKVHKRVRLNGESRKLRWLSYERMKNELPSFTLATRMSFLPHIFDREFGVKDVTSMTPFPGDTGVSPNPSLLVKTASGNYVFRKAGKDVPDAVFNAVVQAHLFEKGIPVRELIIRQVPGEREGAYVLRLGNVPFVLEKQGDEGQSINKSDAGEKHYIALGGLAAQVHNALASFPKNVSPDQKPIRFEEMLNPSVVPGLGFWNVGFSENADDSVFVSRIRELDHPHWADRLRELENVAFEVAREDFLQELITAYSYRIVPVLTEMELQSLYGATKKAVMRESFDKQLKAKLLAEKWIRNAQMQTPSTLSWVWANLPTHKSSLDDLLRKAPWESVFLAVGMGAVVAAHLLMGVSINWVLAWIIFAGVLGYSHRWGTYGFVDGQLGPRSGLPAMGKAFSWLFWTSVLGAVLMGLGQLVPMELLPWVLGGATGVAAWVSKAVHQWGNREWVVRHLDYGNLSLPQRDMARDILTNLEKRPIRLGVDEVRAMVVQRAEAYARRAGMGSIDLIVNSPTASLGEGIKLYFVDPVAVRSAVGIENLQSIMKKDEQIYLVAENAIESLPSERVIVVGGAFQSVGGKEKPLFEVSLGAVKGPIVEAVKGQPIRILKTPLLNLNAAGLGADDPLVVASKNAIVLILESLRGFASDVVHWDDVWHVYRALAEAA